MRRPFARKTQPEPELAQLVSLTAASARVTLDDAKRMRSVSLYGWQLQALGYNETLGEVWYAAKFYERSLRNLILKVQRRDPQTGDWNDVDEQIPNGIVSSLVDANGEQSALLGMYGRLVFLTGEARLFGVIDAHTGAEVYEMLSVEEVHVNDQGNYVRRISPIDPNEEIPAAPDDAFRPTGDGAVMFRLWTPSARFSAVADSPMRAVLPICDELLLLTREVRGEIISRLSQNGILYLPSELQLPATQQDVRPDEDPAADLFMLRLTQAMQTGVQDEASASSQIPIIVRGPAESGKSILHIPLTKDSSENAAKRTECIHRLALSLDMPPEALEGIQDTNHWGAWQIDESSWKVHIQPVAQTLVENLTSSWFRPLVGDPDLRIWYDESQVVNHPDRSTDFKDGFDRRVISAAAYADSIGAKEKELMSPEEQDRFALLAALAHRGTDATATPSATAPTAAPAAGTSDTPAPGAAPANAATPVKATTTPVQATGTPAAIAASADTYRILAAAESAVWRCREIAGSRLRSKVDRADFAAVSNINLAHAAYIGDLTSSGVGPRDVLFHDADKLVAGGGALFAHILATWDVPPDVASQIVTAAEAHARDTLFDADPGQMPDGLVALCTLGTLSGDAH